MKIEPIELIEPGYSLKFSHPTAIGNLPERFPIYLKFEFQTLNLKVQWIYLKVFE